MALVSLLAFCFSFLAIAGKLISSAVQNARDESDDTSVLLQVADFFCHLFFSLKLWAGSISALLGAGILYLLFQDVGFAAVVIWLWKVLMFFLPALVANQAAGLARAAKLPGSRIPVNARWLGASKTWGSYYGILLSTATVATQANMPALQSSSVDYAFWPALFFAILMGIGATWGDHLESFLKRRVGIPPGQPWWPWDQTDFAIVSALLVLPLYSSEVIANLLGFMIFMLMLHPLGNFIGYKLRLREHVL